MDTAHLLSRRAAVVARHELLESVPGSGWHRDDPQARRERDDGMPPVSKRLVALHHDGRFYVVGPCVAALREAAGRYYDAATAEWKRVAEEHAAIGVAPPDHVPQQWQAVVVAGRVAKGEGEVIELPSNEFNACVYGLTTLNLPVVTAGVVG